MLVCFSNINFTSLFVLGKRKSDRFSKLLRAILSLEVDEEIFLMLLVGAFQRQYWQQTVSRLEIFYASVRKLVAPAVLMILRNN